MQDFEHMFKELSNQVSIHAYGVGGKVDANLSTCSCLVNGYNIDL